MSNIIDFYLPQDNDKILDFDSIRKYGEDSFKIKAGGATYEVSTHFNPGGRQCVMEQFKELILSEHLI